MYIQTHNKVIPSTLLKFCCKDEMARPEFQSPSCIKDEFEIETISAYKTNIIPSSFLHLDMTIMCIIGKSLKQYGEEMYIPMLRKVYY